MQCISACNVSEIRERKKEKENEWLEGRPSGSGLSLWVMEEMGHWVTDSLPSFAKNLHVLLVDHDPFSLKHLASLLEQQSYNVTTTQLASIALSMIQEKGDRFDLVMANVSMPDMDSFSFLHVLLKMNIAVIFMSSGMNLSVATKALAEGACYFLQKPISKGDLKYMWQHVYRWNRNITKQTYKANCIETAKPRKESVGIQITDAVVLSRSAAAVSYNNNCCINYKPMKNKEKDKSEQIVSHDSLVGSFFGGKRLSADIEGLNLEKRVKYYSEPTKFGFSRIDEDHERRKECYIASDSRTRVVWNAERRRKFTDALNKLARPKLILKMMNEPCLTLRQVANHLQKYKAQVECFKRRESKLPYRREASKSNFSIRTQLPPLVQQHHETSRFTNGGLTSIFGGERFQLIAPKSLPSPRLPANNFINHDLTTLSHNFQHIGSNYDSVSYKVSKEVGLCPDNVQSFQKEGGAFRTDNCGKFALIGGGVQTTELNFSSVSKMTPELASSHVFDETQFPDNLLDGVVQEVDLTAFKIENQEEIHSMSRDIAVPDSFSLDNVFDGGQELPAASESRGNQQLAEYAYLLDVLEEDPYNFVSDLNLSDVDKYSEWLRNTVLENRSGPDSFISDNADAENSPVENRR
ncbi:two-component response regulator ARR11 isoform X3 [Cucumis melo var. makuwa]|uniref:Two-component response regulator ARR11 isoform X3 n=1 Tax=Cucumis melo var. makuwa TaxID=1194695 RepID=A0A5D3BMQ3_CUCMM|nr:two-component response regulator ARR11 isoform X3 [Cucumis melo var. makuwa]